MKLYLVTEQLKYKKDAPVHVMGIFSSLELAEKVISDFLGKLPEKANEVELKYLQDIIINNAIVYFAPLLKYQIIEFNLDNKND